MRKKRMKVSGGKRQHEYGENLPEEQDPTGGGTQSFEEVGTEVWQHHSLLQSVLCILETRNLFPGHPG